MHDWAVTWVRPQAGTTAFLKVTKDGLPVDDVLFCQQLFDTHGVMMVHVSIGDIICTQGHRCRDSLRCY